MLRGSDWYSQRAREVSWPRWWPAGVWSWPGCVCPPLWSGRGGPRWGVPSWASLGSSPPEAQKHFKSSVWMHHKSSVHYGIEETGFHFFLRFWLKFLDRPQTAHKHTHKHTQGSRSCNAAPKALSNSCCSSVIAQVWCCILLRTLRFFLKHFLCHCFVTFRFPSLSLCHFVLTWLVIPLTFRWWFNDNNSINGWIIIIIKKKCPILTILLVVFFGLLPCCS